MFGDLAHAVRLILAGDREVWQIAAVSLQVSLSALALTTLCALPIAYALYASPRRRFVSGVTWIIQTSTALPTVVVGLTLYFVISASGPLGWLNLLYTRTAMIIGQFVLAVPIVATVSLSALRQLPAAAHETVVTLGLHRWTGMRLLLRDVRPALLSGLLLAFARIFTELGAAIILGGNIRGETRTLTTVLALEYNRGDNVRAIALGVILVAIALSVNAAAQAFNRGASPPRTPQPALSRGPRSASPLRSHGSLASLVPGAQAISWHTRHLVVGYQGAAVASVPETAITPDHVWLVTGANGAGKTTLLKTLAALLPPVSGSIEPRPRKGHGGAVFVHSVPYLFAGTVADNLRLSARVESAASQIAADLSLQSLWSSDVRTLSHGQRQRVALARAIVAEPNLLLVDEPEGSLDDASLEAWRTFCAGVAERRHVTLVLAAHRPAGLEGLPVRTIAL